MKTVRWIGSSLKDLKTFPKNIQREMGQALFAAQLGKEDPATKALQGFGGRSVLEIVASVSGATFRTVYTVRFSDALYVLHAFQKKSVRGIATPRKDMDLIRQRLAEAERDHRQRRNR
jgi:phage-related protein